MASSEPAPSKVAAIATERDHIFNPCGIVVVVSECNRTLRQHTPSNFSKWTSGDGQTLLWRAAKAAMRCSEFVRPTTLGNPAPWMDTPSALQIRSMSVLSRSASVSSMLPLRRPVRPATLHGVLHPLYSPQIDRIAATCPSSASFGRNSAEFWPRNRASLRLTEASPDQSPPGTHAKGGIGRKMFC